MHAWEQIQQTIDYIEGHLGEKLSPQELARLAALSPFYYQRLFCRLVKKPVAEYIKLRRMAKASEALRQEDARILDIALSLGFSSHEHFTRVFKDTFGMAPEEYRRHPQPLNRMTKPQLELCYTLVDEGVPLVTEGMVLEINRRPLPEPVCYLGLEKRMPVGFLQGLGTESGADPLDTLWRDFHGRKTGELGLAEEGEELGCTLPCPAEGYFCYFAGGRVPAGTQAPGFVSWTLPKGDYIVCAFEAEDFQSLVMDALYKALQYVYGTWLPRHGLQAEAFCAERYPSHGPQTTNMEIWLKLLG